MKPGPLLEDPPDAELVASAQNGDRSALETLVRRHQPFVYNVALRMVWKPEDAQDVTQEVLTKVVTRLSTFRGESAFRTWVFRITANHVLNMKKRGSERSELSFEEYARRIEGCADGDPPRQGEFAADPLTLVEEAKIACTTGMLLCLSREQRLVFILGLLGVDDGTGAEILGTSRANYRQKLSRARKDLFQFMSHQCGLVDPKNPCRCARKTRAFIAAGVVDPDRLRFHPGHLRRVKDVVVERTRELEEWLELFSDHPFPQGQEWAGLAAEAGP
jgi:RNA polymerase sigma factor (sigma-70 family)